MGCAKRQGAVAAGDVATAAAAAEILSGGGNAFDAALAGMLAACVAEPVLASIGGGGFMLAHPAAGPPRLFDFFTCTPGMKAKARAQSTTQAALDFRAVEADFTVTRQEFHIGAAAAATPGLPAGLFAIAQRMGRLPVAEIAAPALRLARDGVSLSPLQAQVMDIVAPIMLDGKAARQLNEDPERPGKTLPDGAQRRVGGFADFLERLVREGPRFFYEGEPAAAIADLCRDGGLLVRDDLARYRVQVRRPLRVAVAGRAGPAQLFINPPPSAGGALIALALRLCEGGGLANLAFEDPHRALLLADVMSATAEARRARAGSVARLLADEGFMADLARRLEGHAQKTGGTTHISVADGDGNLAALSLSNGEGCGLVIPGTDQMLNNMLGEEDLNLGGFFRWRPRSRVTSMMAPCSLIMPDGRRLALGSGGSNRIRSAILQTVLNLHHGGLSPTAAIAAPRLHWERGRLDIENGWSQVTQAALETRHPHVTRWPARDFFFGGVHGVAVAPNGHVVGVGDPRRAGVGLSVATGAR